jgi:hypothetical protein
VVVNLNDRSDSKEDQPMGVFNPTTLSSFTPPVTAIAVSPYALALTNDARTSSPLVLIGRADGSVDLFYFETGELLTTWADISIYQPAAPRPSTSSLYDPSAAAIVYGAWVSWSSPSFIVIDSNGFLYFFDLFRESSKPLFVEELSLSSSSLLPNLLSLSLCRSIGGAVHLAVGEVDSSVAQQGLKIRKVSDELVWSAVSAAASHEESKGGRGEGKGEDEKDTGGRRKQESHSHSSGSGAVVCMSPSQSAWIGRVTGSNVVMEFRGGNTAEQHQSTRGGGRK